MSCPSCSPPGLPDGTAFHSCGDGRKMSGAARVAAMVQEGAFDALADAERLAAIVLLTAQRQAADLLAQARAASEMLQRSTVAAAEMSVPFPAPAAHPASAGEEDGSRGSSGRVQRPRRIWVEEPPQRAQNTALHPAANAERSLGRHESWSANVDPSDQDLLDAEFLAIVGHGPVRSAWQDGHEAEHVTRDRRAEAIRVSAQRAAARASAERRAIQADALARRQGSRRAAGDRTTLVPSRPAATPAPPLP